MEIKINIEDWKCDNLLRMNDYVSEEVTAYYKDSVNPYDNESDGVLHPVKVKIAYRKYHKPNELDKEYPMLDNLKDYDYQKVVNELFSLCLWNLVVG